MCMRIFPQNFSNSFRTRTNQPPWPWVMSRGSWVWVKSTGNKIATRVESRVSKRQQDTHIHGSGIHNSTKTEATQVPINRGMAQQNVVTHTVEYYSPCTWVNTEDMMLTHTRDIRTTITGFLSQSSQIYSNRNQNSVCQWWPSSGPRHAEEFWVEHPGELLLPW